MKLITTPNYILWVDIDSIKTYPLIPYWDTAEQELKFPHAEYNERKSYRNPIIAHLPLNNAPLLEGVDLLPDFPTKKQIQKDVTYNYNEYGQATAFDIANSYGVSYGYCKSCETNSPQIDGNCLICGSSVELPKQEYAVEQLANKATDAEGTDGSSTKAELVMFKQGFLQGFKANTNKYSEEDMRKAIKRGVDLWAEGIITANGAADKVLQSLSTTALPTEFIAEYETVYFHGSGYYKENELSEEEQIKYAFMKEEKIKTIKVTIQGVEINQICGIYK